MRYTFLLFLVLSIGYLPAQPSLYFSVGPEIRFGSEIGANEITKLDPKIPVGKVDSKSDYIGSNTTLPVIMGLLIPLSNEQSKRPRATESYLQVGLGFTSGNLVGALSRTGTTSLGDTFEYNNALWRVDTLYDESHRVEVQSDFIRLDVGAFVRAFPKKKASTCLGIGLIGGYSFSSRTEVNSSAQTYSNRVQISDNGFGGIPPGSFSQSTSNDQFITTPGIWALSLYTSMRIEFALRKPELSLRNTDLFFLELRPQTMLESYGSRGFNFSSASIQLLMGFSISL